MKVCTKCGMNKNLDCFSKHRGHKDELNSWCKDCVSVRGKERYIVNGKELNSRNYAKNKHKRLDKHYRERYGITTEEKQRIIVAQSNKCACCGDIMDGPRNQNVDHDHVTGKVREILCGPCNKGLGYFRDNINRMLLGIQYLIKHGENK